MLIEMVVGFVVGSGAVMALGLPIVRALAQPRAYRAPASAQAEGKKARVDPVAAFQPLDLGPDPVKWPSERPWQLRSTLADPQWPSLSWNDEHFGQHWKNHPQGISDTGFHAMAKRNADAAAAGEPVPHFEPQTAPVPKPAAAAGVRREAAKAEPKPPSQPRRRQAAPPAEPAPASRTNGPPDPAEIEHLIATVGLAGTVQTIMARTGWEFREAAQYLAKVRKA